MKFDTILDDYGNLKYKCEDGRSVRSLQEQSIANTLWSLDIKYVYEEKVYYYTEEEKEEALKGMEKGVNVQRYKGLGEMSAEQLWETTMNPETRTLKKVTMKDEVTCNEIFDILMGDRPEARREFIEKNAKYVKDLDKYC